MNGPGQMRYRMRQGGSCAGARSAERWNGCGSRSATVTTTGKRKPRRTVSAGVVVASKVSKAISSDYVTILSYNGIYGPIERGIIYRVFV